MKKVSAVGVLLLTGKRWGAENYFPPALGPSRGELDLDVGAEGGGDFFERRQETRS